MDGEKMRQQSGFSIAELLVVAGILVIIAAMAMPYLVGAIQNSNFNAAIRQVASDARFARSLAVSRGGYYRLQTLNNTYRLEHCNSCNAPVGWPATSAQMGVSTDVITDWQDLSSLYGGTTIQSVSVADGAIFNSTGASIDSSNSVRSITITLQKPDGTSKVIQVGSTGNVKIL